MHVGRDLTACQAGKSCYVTLLQIFWKAPMAMIIPEVVQDADDMSVDLPKRVDQLGAAASIACAVHCASWPFLLALLPSLGLTWLASESVEQGFVIFATLWASGSLLMGYRRHRAFRALGVLLPGLALVWLSTFGPWHHDVIPHAVGMTAGGTLVALAHLINLRLSHGHVHDASCRH
ncbi:MAG: MerC mercury resistance protein [Alphaproteobacteria bacterium ADurb.BinA280]|jgi:hypothetical protein|nr:MAG: MerC mercury resistance protein [Alphaproteobacteria bacterium ADurb.BinA280]